MRVSGSAAPAYRRTDSLNRCGGSRSAKNTIPRLSMKATLLAALMCCLSAGCISTDSKVGRSNRRHFAGNWYRGDGTGYNVTLTLKKDGTYDAVWVGCLGTYGTAAGSWEATPEQITLTPKSETGMMENHLRSLTVFPEKTGFVLVPPDARDGFPKWGADSPYWCFSRSR